MIKEKAKKHGSEYVLLSDDENQYQIKKYQSWPNQ
jgi:hypothetical protein